VVIRDNPADRLATVCTLDPAIDHLRCDIATFAETRDLSKLAFVPGRAPIVFHLRPIGSHLMTSYVDATPSVADKWRRAFMASVERIEGMLDEHGRASVYLPTTPLRLPKRELMIIGDDDIDDVADRLGGHAWFYEIGHVAYERAHLGKALRDGGVSWSLPPSSQAVLARMRRRAAQSLATSATTSFEKSSAGSQPTSAEGSGAATDAGAQESVGTSVPDEPSTPESTSAKRRATRSSK
jgi:hypothetical protein